MKPKGDNILVRPKAREKVLASGIIIPDTVTPKSMQWGCVLEGKGDIKEGMSVLFYGGKCSTKDKGKDTEEKIVSINKILLYDGE